MKMFLCCVLLFTGWMTSKADTLTLQNNRSINGEVTYDRDMFFIDAHFRGYVDKMLAINREKVKYVEINESIDNPGSPPDWLASYEDLVFYAKYNPVSGTEREKDQGFHQTSSASTVVSSRQTTTRRTTVAATEDIVKLSDGQKRRGGLTLLNRVELSIKINHKTEKLRRKSIDSIVVGH